MHVFKTVSAALALSVFVATVSFAACMVTLHVVLEHLERVR